MSDWPEPVERKSSRSGLRPTSQTSEIRDHLHAADELPSAPIEGKYSRSASRPTSRASGLRDHFRAVDDLPASKRSSFSSPLGHPGTSIAQYVDAVMLSPERDSTYGGSRPLSTSDVSAELPVHSSRMLYPTEPNTGRIYGNMSTPFSDRYANGHGDAIWRVEERGMLKPSTRTPRTRGSISGSSNAKFPQNEVTHLLERVQDGVEEFSAARDRHDKYEQSHSMVSDSSRTILA